ncbi:STAS-like domain-containing protein [Chitinibacter sp. GC72]|uniref:STAS-like domain-containing protein n=1 Tax=Chitinibacter sp. GC72 TaxID=1526917 RepID=UPI0012F89D0B|nr:STAS-like domain-containing protein [Chitinibacter sp. GC72]
MLINIAKDFSPFAAGRYQTDGPCSGEAFRDLVLVPKLEQHKMELVTVNLDGTLGLGSSFLEEAFGGLIRKGFKKDYLHSYLIIECKHQSYVDAAWSYIDGANNDGK